MQTFIGFANGRYIFSSTDGFLNYARNRIYVECSNGSHLADRAVPGGRLVTGPVLLYLQQAGVGGLTVEEAGTQSIPQKSLAFFVQDKWQPSRNLTVQYGLRWEGEKQADPITPVERGLLQATSSARPSTPRRAPRPSPPTAPSPPTTRCGSPEWASPGTPRVTARASCA